MAAIYREVGGELMDSRKLNGTDLETGRVVLGTMTFGS
jgi:hypothetical protein